MYRFVACQEALAAAGGGGEKERLQRRLEQLVKSHPVMLFMKGGWVKVLLCWTPCRAMLFTLPFTLCSSFCQGLALALLSTLAPAPGLHSTASLPCGSCCGLQQGNWWPWELGICI